MERVRDILDVKGHEVVSVKAEDLVIDALLKMEEKNIGAILVLDDQGKAAGIFSERDFARKIIFKGRTCNNTKVADIMTPDPLCISPDTSLEDCMRLMTMKKFRHLPVLSGGKIEGLVSIGDVVKALIESRDRKISEQAFEIGLMERVTTSGVV
jgi:CBS domain-containing protein